jgi:putative membrane protein
LDAQRTFAITRPDEALMKYYVLKAFTAGPAFPLLLTLLYFRFHTMRFRFDEEGISMSWGILFRREIVLNYSRIQDVHLQSNAIERWFGLARIDVQTASGGSAPEMTLEGIRDYDGLRDFLYSRMRGAKGHAPASAVGDTLSATLQAIAAELRALRQLIEEKRNV